MKKQHHNHQPTKSIKHEVEHGKNIKDQTDYKKLESMTDDDIDYSDIPEMEDLFWAKGKVIDPGPKKAISFRVDEDVLDWFKHEEGRYQYLMNQVLRKYMNAHRDSRSR